MAPTCTSYRPGHRAHFVQINLTARSPWAWVDVVVLQADGELVRLQVLDDDSPFEAWHHRDLSPFLPPGSPSRLHLRHHVLSTPVGLASVAHDCPLAAPEDPPVPGPWAPEVGVGITDLSLGYGVEIRPGPSM